MTDSQRDEAMAACRLEACVAACERWAASRAVPACGTAGNGPSGEDQGVVVNGVFVRTVRPAGCGWFFEPSGMLRAAGIPEGEAAVLVEAGRGSGHAAECRLPEAPGPVWLVDLDGCGEYAARRRGAVRSGLEAAIRRDGAEEALDGLDEAEDALCRLEECVARCRDRVASRGEPSDACPSPCVEYPDVDWAAFLDDPYAVPQPVAGPVPGSGAVSPWDSLIPKAVAGSGVADTLLGRLPVLCRAFGISQLMPREWQLAWIVWLMAFRGEPVDCPSEGTAAEAAFLWRGMARRGVRDLVASAMAD